MLKKYNQVQIHFFHKLLIRIGIAFNTRTRKANLSGKLEQQNYGDNTKKEIVHRSSLRKLDENVNCENEVVEEK